MVSRWKKWVGVVAIFLCGMLCGAGLTVRALKRAAKVTWEQPHTMAENITRNLRHNLKLDDSQETTVRQILVGVGEKMRTVRQETQPKFDAIVRRAEDDVRKILRPEQVTEFNRLRASQRAKQEQEQAEKNRP